jgi:HAD superfamily hydrolase (TIGR01459 family)
MTVAEIPIISSIAGLAQGYQAWIVDIWGVMHDGARAFDAAGEACRRFRAQGGVVLLLSNAPRPFSAVIPHMASLGVDPAAYDGGVTSGDATREMLAAWQGRPVLHVGPARDTGLFEGLDIRLADADTAEMILCSGLYDDTRETPDDYAGLFARLSSRGVPMICANPDILVGRGDKLVYCAGALAAAYAGVGGQVTYAGKPHLPIYQRARREIARIKGQAVADSKVLCIGDGIGTDLEGAHAAGLASVFIASPVSAPNGIDAASLAALFARRSFAPIAAMTALAWR